MNKIQLIKKRWGITLTCALIALLSGLLSLPMRASTRLRELVPAKETKTFQASKDNTVIESAKGDLSNGVGPVLLVGRTGQPVGGIRRALIAFDLASIPAGSKITSVKLVLNVSLSAGSKQQGGGAAKEQITLNRALSDWGEGKSSSEGGRGAQASEGDATWIYTFYPKSRWSKPGGDYATGESATQTVADAGAVTFGSTPQMVVDVQYWLDSPKANFGWLLRGDETQGATARVFLSRESRNVSARPQLIVTFTAPDGKSQ